MFKNKLNEHGLITRNKEWLVAEGYNQQEGIGFGETYAPVARWEALRLLLAYAYVIDFKLYQMDVKSVFLNGYIEEEFYVSNPLGFKDHKNSNYVYKLKKDLYGLKQAPWQWYGKLSNFLLQQKFDR